jgi:hypothetical protein
MPGHEYGHEKWRNGKDSDVLPTREEHDTRVPAANETALANGEAHGDGTPPTVPEDSRFGTNKPRAKIDKANLAQNIFNSAAMRDWFDSISTSPVLQLGSKFVAPGHMSLSFALCMLKLYQKLRAESRPDERRCEAILDYGLKSSRYAICNTQILLKQWVKPAPRILLTSLPGSVIKSVVDSQGKIIDSIVPLNRCMTEFNDIREPRVRKHVFDCLWHALDHVLIAPVELGIHSRRGGTDVCLNDEQAVQIIVVAICALLNSIPSSNPATLTAVLAARSMGQTAWPKVDSHPSAHEPDPIAPKAYIQVADAFEYQPAIRLAEKTVMALATRRAFWSAARDSRHSAEHTGTTADADTFPVLHLVMAHLIAQGMLIRPARSPQSTPQREIFWQGQTGLSPGSILLEWLKIVIHNTWDGSAIVSRWTPAGAAMEIMKDIHEVFVPQLNFWDLTAQEYTISVLFRRLHAHKAVPEYLQWVQANPPGSMRYKNERHVLEFPFLFEHGRRTFYFRLMLYHQMFLEWQSSRAHRELLEHFRWLVAPGDKEYQCPNLHCNHAMCERLRLRRRQAQLWRAAGYNETQRAPNNFWNRNAYLTTKLAKMQAKFLLLDIERQTILESALNQVWGREKRELLKPLKVVMRMDGKDEEAADHGGVSQEFFRLVLSKAFDPEYGLFAVAEEQSRMNWFTPLSLEPLQTYELLGLLLGMAVSNSITLPVNFPHALYIIICGGSLDTLLIADGWPSLGKAFAQLSSWNEEKDGSVEDVFARDYAFTFEAHGVTYTIDMLTEDPKSIKWPLNPGDAPPAHWTDDSRTFQPVTAANRIDFIKQYRQWLVYHSVQPQLDAFLKGFHHIIPRLSTSFMTARSLHAVVEGGRNIDVAALRAATSYASSSTSPHTTFADDYSPSHPTVRSFWRIVEKYDQAKLRKLLTFVTASDRVPAQGYSAIGFNLEKHGGTDMLPTSSTCFGKLFMPPYQSEETLERMLGVAIEEGTEGFGFI